MNRAAYTAVVVAVAATASCTPRPRTFPYTWQLYGVVLSVDESVFTVRHKSGHHVTLEFDARTAFVKNNEATTSQSLLHWSRVIVDVETRGDGGRYARVVRITGGGEPWPKQPG